MVRGTACGEGAVCFAATGLREVEKGMGSHYVSLSKPIAWLNFGVLRCRPREVLRA